MSTPAAPELIVIRQRYTPYGGAERFVTAAMKSLAEAGVAVTIVAREWQGEGPFRSEIRTPFHLGRRWRDRAFARSACAYVAGHPGALVQSHERLPCCDLYRAGDGVHREWLHQRARLRGPAAALLDRLSPYHRATLAAEARLFASPRLKAVVCNSAMVKEEIRHHFGLPEERLRVIHNGVDAGAFHPAPDGGRRGEIRRRWDIPERATLFLFLGSGFERKGLAAALHALARQGEEAWLLVVGKERRTAAYVRLAERLEVAARVRFAGPQREVLPFYHAADAFVFPTLYDPFPNVVLEAMACGLPVVTSLKCGAVDILRDGDNGLLCDALDHAALARHMAALRDPERRRVLGAAARATVAPMSFERMTAAYLDLYRELLAEAAPQTKKEGR